MAEAIRRQLGSYDCRHIFEAVVNPIVKQVLQEPEVQNALRVRVHGEVNRLVSALNVTTKTSGY